MSTINIFQISFEIWGCIIGIAVCIMTGSAVFESDDRTGRKLWCMVLFNNFLLVSDAIAYIYRGEMTSLGMVMTRISNFALFALEYVILGIFVSYVLLIAGRMGTPRRNWGIAAYSIIALGSAGLIVTPFTGLYYYFDATNHYCRGSGIALSFSACGAVVAICIYILWKSRGCLDRSEKLMFLSCISVFFVCMAGQFIFYGLSFINISITVLFLIMHIGNYSRMLDIRTENRIEEAIRDAGALSEWRGYTPCSSSKNGETGYEENKE